MAMHPPVLEQAEEAGEGASSIGSASRASFHQGMVEDRVVVLEGGLLTCVVSHPASAG